VSGFTHLHCHSTWSLLDGAIPAEALPHAAAALGFEAVALTDHDSLLGAVRFAQACRDAGIKPIYGAELTIRRPGAEPGPNSEPPQRHRAGAPAETQVRSERGRSEEGGVPAAGDSPEHITIIARNRVGYANLCRLITAAHLGNERGNPGIDREALVERAEGLFVLSGCRRGEVARQARRGAIPRALETARWWRAAVGESYRVEVFDHRGYGDRFLRDRLLRVAEAAGVPAVATNDVHYARPQHAGTHELLGALRRIVPLSASNALRPNSEYYLKSAAEMRSLFSDAPEVVDETLRITEACDFDLDLEGYHFPHVSLPSGETPTGRLARLCYEGARRRYGSVPRAIEDRLQHELQLIFRMGFAAYFMVVADIVDHTRRVLGVRCACRGSAAGSLVCYVLGISDVDPVRYDLLFERFMNERRNELPDIDVDVESHRREDVLEYILDAYGSDQTAVCCMTDTFRARMAIREVGKTLGLPAAEIDLVAKAFPRVRAADIPRALERLPELQGSNLEAGQLRQLFELCYEIDGFPRHLALHPSGVILSSPDLADRVPMQESFGGFTMLQADKDDVEALGLVKLDVLGVRMLSAISHAVEAVRRAGDSVDLDAIPRDDDATFRLIRTSRTLGCFQIESPGQRELIARLQPHRFEDLVTDISLFRPGPVSSDMVSPYLDRRHGFAEVAYPHPALRPILTETHGVVVWHEQVIRVIAATTGCSLADADHVRRHLDAAAGEGANVAPSDEGIEAWFRRAGRDNGFSAEQVDAIWAEVSAFAAFGFCKSHAAAFALPTYISAWLKAHYPAEFFAGLLTHDPGMYPLRLIAADARRFGIPILPIDVNRSDAVYRPERIQEPGGSGVEARLAPGPRGSGGSGVEARLAPGPRGRKGVRMALSAVRDISEAEIDSIVAARPFTSLEDLWRRTEVSRPVLENLASVGALDSISGGRSRRELAWRAAEINERSRPAREVDVRQLELRLDEGAIHELPELPAPSPMEETEVELALSGIDARRHMMELYASLIEELGCTPAARLGRVRTNSEVWVAGVKVSTQTPAIRSGKRIIFLTLDDLTGPLDVTLFEGAQPRCAHTVFHGWLLVVKGVVRKRGGASLLYETDPHNVGLTVVADEVFDLADLATARKRGITLADALARQRALQGARTSSAAEYTSTPLSPLGGPASETASTPKPPFSPGSGAKRASTPEPPKLWHASGGSAGR
jgi:error-prone DNA polymerase